MAQHTADYLAFDPSTGTATIAVQLPRERVGITLRFTESPTAFNLATLLAAAAEQGKTDGLLAADAELVWAAQVVQAEAE